MYIDLVFSSKFKWGHLISLTAKSLSGKTSNDDLQDLWQVSGVVKKLRSSEA